MEQSESSTVVHRLLSIVFVLCIIYVCTMCEHIYVHVCICEHVCADVHILAVASLVLMLCFLNSYSRL